MPSREVRIINKLGLHARAASRFVMLASTFESRIHLRKDSREINGKSIMGIMMLAAGRGTSLQLSAEGPDAEMALEALEALINDRFGEKE